MHKSFKSQATKHVRPYKPQDGPSLWICIDKKPVPEVGLYRQIPGGAHGVAFIVSTLLEKQRRGAFSKQSKSIDVVAGLASHALRQRGIEVAKHAKCAAEDNARAIAETVFGNPESVFQKALQIKPDLTEASYENTAAAVERIYKARLITNAPVPDVHGTEAPVVRRYTHVDTAQKTGKLIVNYGRNVAWDGQAAFNTDLMAYHNSFGDLEEIRAGLSHLLPINNYDEMQNVGAVLLAATEHHLRQPNGVSELEVIRLAA